MYDPNAEGGATEGKLSSRLALGAWVATLAIGLWLLAQAYDLGVNRFYNIDELRYAHAAWLVFQGQLPYRDFWDPKFPFLYQTLSLAFIGAGDDPTRVHGMRFAMLAFFAMTGWAGWQINRAKLGRWAVLSPVFMLSLWCFTFVGLEIQPDGLATALFFTALAVLVIGRFPKWARGFLAGALLGLALWTSQKAFSYGSVLGVGFAVDVLYNRRRRVYLLANPLAFVAGIGLVGAGVATYLAATGSLAAWFDLCVKTVVFSHSDLFPDRSLWITFRLLLRDGWVLMLLAAVGVADAVATLRRAGLLAPSHKDVLLLASLVFTFLAWYLQRGPYLYSLVPFMAALCIVAARGAHATWQHVVGWQGATVRRRMVATAGLCALVGIHFVAALTRAGMDRVPDNTYQHHVLSQIAALTGPEDPIYDNSGSYVARPHAFDPYFTNFLMRTKSMTDRLAVEVPEAIQRSSCAVFLFDARAIDLPPPLRVWLAAHFRPVTRDIWLWGKRFRFSGDPGEFDTFHAFRAAYYTIWPQEALQTGTILVDGVAVGSKGFPLASGAHMVTFAGPRATAFDIVWSPSADGLPPNFASPPQDLPSGRFSYIEYFEHIAIPLLP
jgi:hypothetical protein